MAAEISAKLLRSPVEFCTASDKGEFFRGSGVDCFGMMERGCELFLLVLRVLRLEIVLEVEVNLDSDVENLNAVQSQD